MGYTHNNEIEVPIQIPENVSPEDVSAPYVDPLDNSYWLGVPMINILPDGKIELLVDYRIEIEEFLNNRNVGWCEIMQIKYVHIEGTSYISYHAVIKTFWLREFQRRLRRRLLNKAASPPTV